MNIRQIRIVIFGLVIALMIWPLVHHLLVERYQLDKWSFLGFSMYVTAKPFFANEELQFFSAGRLINEHEEFGEEHRKVVMATIYQFQADLVSYGILCDPNEMARDILGSVKRADAFTFEFDLLHMDRASAVFVGERIRYDCKRDSEGQTTCVETRTPIDGN